MIDQLSRLLGPLRTRVANMVARAVVELVDDRSKLQALQLGVLDEETRGGCERFQEYGFTSHPHPGAEAVTVFVGGRRDHGLVVAVDDRRYRVSDLQAGEVAIYTDEGDRILFGRGRQITVTGGARVIVDSPDIQLAQPASDAAVKGTTYRAAEDAWFAALVTAFGAVNTALQADGALPAPAKLAVAAAITGALTAAKASFDAGASGYLSEKVKVG